MIISNLTMHTKKADTIFPKRRCVSAFVLLSRTTKTAELFNVSKDIEEFGRFKEEIVRILQFLLDEPAEVCYS